MSGETHLLYGRLYLVCRGLILKVSNRNVKAVRRAIWWPCQSVKRQCGCWGRRKWTLLDPRIGPISRIISSSGRKPRGGRNFFQVRLKFWRLSLKFSLFPGYSGGCGYSANASAALGANIKVKFLFDKFKLVCRRIREEMGTPLTNSGMSTVLEWPVKAVRK